MSKQLSTPILFLIFNRINTTQKVFEKIKKAKPKELYLASDGPRKTKAGEDEVVNNVRNWVLENVDWDCNIHTLFRETNLGCGKAVSQAITWFFENVEQGIILEDDILVSDSFFPYMEALLNHYKDNEHIMHITGHNPLTISKNGEASYYFSHNMHCWGWASWRRAWQKYSFNITNIHDFCKTRAFKNSFKMISARNEWECIFDMMEKHEIDTWDHQWNYCIQFNQGICINPCKNLITNIGFGADATHTCGEVTKLQDRFEINEIVHPKNIKVIDKYCKKINIETLGIKKTTPVVAFKYYLRNYIKPFFHKS